MFKIYVQNKPLFLINQPGLETLPLQEQVTTVFAHKLNEATISTMLRQMQNDSVSTGIFQNEKIDELLQAFKSHLFLIQAAGGVVFTPQQEILLIFRRGKWDLPKGKLDEGESLETCALREIEEETGLQTIEIIQPLTITYHTYYERDNHILKESHWYLVRCETPQPLRPQIEEDIEQCLWVHVDELPSYFPNMHTSLIDVMKEGLKQVTSEI